MTIDSGFDTLAHSNLLEKGFCVIDGQLPSGKLEELGRWSDRWLKRFPTLERWKYQGSDVKLGGVRTHGPVDQDLPSDAMVDFLIEHPVRILDSLGLDDFRSIGHFQIISKPAHSPALYWYQDWMRWKDPVSLSPWPQTVFLNWYLTDTTRENGCLRVIPGSHRKRLEIHEHLTPPHEGGGYNVAEDNGWMFYDHPDAVDVPVKAGELVVADARLLHGTYPNRTTERRTLLLGWFYRRSNAAPGWFRGEIPKEIRDRERGLKWPYSRIPGEYLR